MRATVLNRRPRLVALVMIAALATPVAGQFTNRYPKVDGYAHHIYLEGYELPLFTVGPVDAAPSPDGRSVAVAHRGWLWSLDPASGEARRLTSGPGIDSRPAWSPDGKTIAFVRDDTRDTAIFALDLETGAERPLLNTAAIDLDPAFSRDGKWLYYSSGEAGDIDIWRLELAGGGKERLTSDAGLELRPLPLPDGQSFVFMSKTRRGSDEVRLLRLQPSDGSAASKWTNLRSVAIASQTRPALSPDGRVLALTLPLDDSRWALYLMDLQDPRQLILLEDGGGLPVTPAWSADGERVYFSEAGDDRRFVLKSAAAVGGETVAVPVHRWDWGVPTRLLTVRTELEGEARPVPARLSAWDANGHPLAAGIAPPRFDSQNGRVYFYSPGVVELEAPVGAVRLAASQGLSTPEASLEVADGDPGEATLRLRRVWEPKEAGYFSGDHHFHLNYGGPYRLTPEALTAIARAEDLDVITPQAANLHNRPQDLQWWSWSSLKRPPLIAFAQEVRSHFLGHLGLLGIGTPYWPWFWGPGYPVRSRDDRPNADALQHARRQGGVGVYVHPVSVPNPFDESNLSKIPLELIPDAVLGDLDGLEVACLWSDELGTSEVWYRLLNLGLPIAPTAGTDAFPNFYRSMAIGTTRVYVRPEGPLNMGSHLEGLRQGKSFVTNGPMLDFRIGEARPGSVVAPSQAAVGWDLELHSALPVEGVEILVNGEVVHREPGLAAAGGKRISGDLRLPTAGWVAVRAHGGTTVWPSMDSYPFAHTAPIWIGEKGSFDPTARRQAAKDLLRVLDVAGRRFSEGYGDTPSPRIKERFDRTRQLVAEWAAEN